MLLKKTPNNQTNKKTPTSISHSSAVISHFSLSSLFLLVSDSSLFIGSFIWLGRQRQLLSTTFAATSHWSASSTILRRIWSSAHKPHTTSNISSCGEVEEQDKLPVANLLSFSNCSGHETEICQVLLQEYEQPMFWQENTSTNVISKYKYAEMHSSKETDWTLEY